jgi:hypothetical protein
VYTHRAAVTNHSALIDSPRFSAIPPNAIDPMRAIDTQIMVAENRFLITYVEIVRVLYVRVLIMARIPSTFILHFFEMCISILYVNYQFQFPEIC